MGIPAFNSLMKTEYMLYGGRSGLNANCPSYLNGYMGGSGLNNGYNTGYYPSFRGQDIFTASNDATRVNNQIKQMQESNPQVAWNNPQFRGLSDDLNELGDYYVKHSAPSESFMGAAVGGVTFGLINNPRTIFHPWNSIKSSFNKDLKNMFADVKNADSALNKLYTNKAIYNGKEFKGGYELVSEAYARMHKLESLTKGKLGWFRRSLKKVPGGMDEYARIKDGLAKALKAGNIDEIAKYTEEAKRLGNAFTGFIPKGIRKWEWLGNKFASIRKKYINPSHYEGIEGVVTKNITESTAKSTLGSSMAHSCGIKNGLFFAAFEFLNDLFLEKKIQKAFDKDSSTGWTQILQTCVKGVGSAAGWAVGEGIGAWAGAKAGAMLGTSIAPGVGTVIGAVAGLVGGSIGMWLMGKVTHAFIGDDVGTKAEVEKMKQTAEGQVQLLQLTAQQAQDDKKLNQKTLNAINNVAQFYSTT